MLHEITASVRRWAGLPAQTDAPRQPLVRLGDEPHEAVSTAQTDIGSLRGVTPAAADTAECTCPEPCERDHANE